MYRMPHIHPIYLSVTLTGAVAAGLNVMWLACVCGQGRTPKSHVLYITGYVVWYPGGILGYFLVKLQPS